MIDEEEPKDEKKTPGYNWRDLLKKPAGTSNQQETPKTETESFSKTEPKHMSDLFGLMNAIKMGKEYNAPSAQEKTEVKEEVVDVADDFGDMPVTFAETEDADSESDDDLGSVMSVEEIKIRLNGIVYLIDTVSEFYKTPEEKQNLSLQIEKMLVDLVNMI
jgi:hypothetical protein